MIVTDGVFSMDGNVAPLPEICDLADRYNALVFVDECHATGFFGETGRFVYTHTKNNDFIMLIQQWHRRVSRRFRSNRHH